MLLSRTINARALLSIALALVVFFAVGALFASYFAGLDTSSSSLGIDNIFYALRDWTIHYDVDEGLRNPPWSVLPLLPLGQLDSGTAWGWLVYLTLIVIIAAVPRIGPSWRVVLATVIAIISFPTLRNIADANLEGLLIAGAALLVTGYRRQDPLILALGVLLVTVKPQASFVLLPVVALLMLKTWPRALWLRAAGLVLAVVLPTMLWRGADWLAAIGGTYQAGSIIDISLSAALARAGLASPLIVLPFSAALLGAALYVVARSGSTLSREKAALLMATSMLLAPYVAGNSMATVLVIGVIPYFLRYPWRGAALILLYNIPFVFLPDETFRQNNIAYWWTFTLLVSWAVFLHHSWRAGRSSVDNDPPVLAIKAA